MVLESTSPLVLRSPVQGRPTIAWAAVLSQGARGLELAVTFLDSTVGGIALCLLNGTGLFDASKGGHVTGRIKDMMIVRGRTVSRTILRSLCEGTCLSCVGGGLSCSKMRRTLSIASWRICANITNQVTTEYRIQIATADTLMNNNSRKESG